MFAKKAAAILVGLVFAFVLCEVILRIYNPFQSRVRGNEIILKSNYKQTIEMNPAVPGLDLKIRYSTNSLGFRGPELPKDTTGIIKIITVGGSTTECSLLSDDSTWSARLYQKLLSNHSSLWLNNAGIDGCSTYGHVILMRDYVVKLKPDFVIFLIGINDLAKSEFDQEDGFLLNRKEAAWRKLLKKSELFTTISNVVTAMKTEKVSLTHGKNPKEYINDRLNKMDDTQRLEFEKSSAANLKSYMDRVTQLNELCKSAAITPVFITQPKYDDSLSYSWQAMLKYNEALIDYCKTNGISCIDLGSTLPKEVTYYYDPIHFTNAGSEAIASILYPEIATLIQSKKY